MLHKTSSRAGAVMQTEKKPNAPEIRQRI